MKPKFRFTSAFALAAGAALLAAPAGARDISTIDGWELSTTGKTCTMVTTFADDVMIGLILSPKTGELGFIAAGTNWKELRSQKTVAVDLTFDGAAPILQWEDQRAVVDLGGLGRDAAIASWGPEHAADLAKAVTTADHVTIRVGDRTLGSYDLSGSPAAYRALTHCGSQIATK